MNLRGCARSLIAPFGEFRPLVAGDTPEARQANRRIEAELDED